MELPKSKFAGLKVGQQRPAKIFFVERLAVLLVARNIGPKVTLENSGKKYAALTTNTIAARKNTVSFFSEKDHILLQEEGPNHLLTRIGD